MASITRNDNHSYSLWRPTWLPPVEVTKHFQLPVLEPSQLKTSANYATSFVRQDDCEFHRDSLIHGYVNDDRLMAIARSPQRYLSKFSNHLAVITPDFSLKLGMPRHDRIRSVFMGRAVGAYFQYHGLNVVPNVRWAELHDLDFVLDGLPQNGTVAFSTQGLLKDMELFKIFVSGMTQVLVTIKPSEIILYGKSRPEIDLLLQHQKVISLPTDFTRAHCPGVD